MNKNSVVIIGKESTGKSQLVASLTGQAATSSNFRGSTVACETYSSADREFVDTPGLLFQSDAETTRLALAQMQQSDQVLLVAQATHIDDDLRDLLPLVKAKRGAVVVTFWDKLHKSDALPKLDALSRAIGLPVIPVDARHLTPQERARILAALDHPATIQSEDIQSSTNWRIEPQRTILEHKIIGPLFAIILLLLPALVAVYAANHSAEWLDPLVQSVTKRLVAVTETWPELLRVLLAGDYGLLTMGPLLFVWAVPTVLLYALILGAFKASGLLDRLTTALHPLLRPFGLTGRDVVRVLMGFGCNVPAVISTRACSSCTRSTCISAIAFGAACSYQLGATLGVFAAANRPGLALPFLTYLTVTTLLYTRLTASPEARSPFNILYLENRVFLEWPPLSAVWREAKGTIGSFFQNALPVFIVICVMASLLSWIGLLKQMATLIKPALAAFRLPIEAALPVIMASIRKDGILLFAQQENVAALSSGQLLTAVYLAGVLLPCLVTALTIAKEQSLRFALRLLARQAFAAIVFSLILAWGALLF
jgi:Fe2+ transport system protein B